MYFSLITPADDRERDAVHERLGGPYADHQWLWRLFPSPEGTSRDFLFRRDEIDGLPRYYVVSARAPETAGSAWRVHPKNYDPHLQAGQQLHFQLRANPSVRHARNGKSRRHDVVMEAKKKMLAERGLARWDDWQGDDKPALYDLVQQSCTAWLARRADRMGFSIAAAGLVVERYQQHAEKRDEELQFTTVDFSGRLSVTDPGAFQTALFNGVGHGKAFGCGLLMVRRLD